MTHETELPPGLAALERALLASRAEPDADLKSRVISSVDRELARSRHREFWRYAAAVAAAVLLILNLSFSAARTSSPPAPGVEREQVQAACDEIRNIGLDLPSNEIARQAALLTAARDLPPYRQPYGSLLQQESSD